MKRRRPFAPHSQRIHYTQYTCNTWLSSFSTANTYTVIVMYPAQSVDIYIYIYRSWRVTIVDWKWMFAKQAPKSHVHTHIVQRLQAASGNSIQNQELILVRTLLCVNCAVCYCRCSTRKILNSIQLDERVYCTSLTHTCSIRCTYVIHHCFSTITCDQE